LAPAQMAELVDALVSGTSAARRGGSSPLLGTIKIVTGAKLRASHQGATHERLNFRSPLGMAQARPAMSGLGLGELKALAVQAFDGGELYSGSFSHDGMLVASGSGDKPARLRAVGSGAEVRGELCYFQYGPRALSRCHSLGARCHTWAASASWCPSTTPAAISAAGSLLCALAMPGRLAAILTSFT
jgi:hypothetical protein